MLLRAGVVVALVHLALTGCDRSARPDGGASPPPAPAVGPGTKAMVEILTQLATRTGRADDPMASSLRVKAMRAAPEPTDPSQRVQARARLGMELVRSGQNQDAAILFEDLLATVAAAQGQGVREFQSELVDWIALNHLSAALRDWCLNGPPDRRCLVPAPAGGAGGPELRQRHAKAALASYRYLTQLRPDDLAVRWLYNLAASLIGPEALDGLGPARLPDSLFRSEYPLARFPDIAPSLGLDITSHAGGSILDDFDGDGDLDLMVSSMGLDDQLRYFRNEGDGLFRERTAEAGLTGLVGGLNINQADYDNDGDLDVLVLRGGWDHLGGQPTSLLQNRGDGFFDDVTQRAGLFGMRATQTGAWGDYDNDGWLDLYLGNESTERPVPNQLFHNDHRGGFTDVTAATGAGLVGYTKGVAWGDYDNDGRVDLYVSRMDKPNVLLRNAGPVDGGGWRFVDVTKAAGVAEPVESFSTWFWDYDNDGWLDLFVIGYRYLVPRNMAGDVAAEYLGRPFAAERPRLYHNNHRGGFDDVTSAVHLDRVIYAMGANFGDLDNDGWPDFYGATGDPDFRSFGPNRMFRNDSGRRFQDVTTAGGFGLLTKGHGISFGDIDDDGDQDIYANMGGMFEADRGRSALFQNPGSPNHWITLRLVGRRSNRAAIGARIAVTVDDGRTGRAIHALVTTGGSFGANTLQQEIGLGDARAIRAVTIQWPGGATTSYHALMLDHVYRIVEDDPTPALVTTAVAARAPR